MSRVREGPRLLLRPHSGRQNQLSVDTALAKEKAGSVWAPLFSSAGKDYPPRCTLILKTGPALTLVFFFTRELYMFQCGSSTIESMNPRASSDCRTRCGDSPVCDTAPAKEKAGSVWAPLFSSAGKDYPPERSTLILKTGPALTLVFFFTAAGYGQATRSARFEARPQTTQYDRSAC